MNDIDHSVSLQGLDCSVSMRTVVDVEVVVVVVVPKRERAGGGGVMVGRHRGWSR